MANFTVISYHTPDWHYPEFAEKLQRDCVRLGLDYHIESRGSNRTYVDNCNIKPFFIRETIKKLARPVLWIDVDASINQIPAELETITRDFDVSGNRNVKSPDRVYVNSIWFNYTPASLVLIDRWCEYVVDSIDDGAFNKALAELKSEIRFFELPEKCHRILRRYDSEVPGDSYFVHRLSNSDLKWSYKNKVERR